MQVAIRLTDVNKIHPFLFKFIKIFAQVIGYNEFCQIKSQIFIFLFKFINLWEKILHNLHIFGDI